MLDSLPSADPNERVTTLNGLTLTNSDLSSLRPMSRLSDPLFRYLMERLRAQGESIKTLGPKRGILILALMDFHELIRGNSATGSDINTMQWMTQTAAYRGRGQTIFHIFGHIIAPIRLSTEHVVLLDIRPQGGFPSHPSNPEIVLFDSDQKEWRHLHNSLYLALKRFIYEETLDKSGLSQAEAYQDSLGYSFRRGACAQQAHHPYSREKDPDALIFPLRTLTALISGHDPENTSLSTSARDLENSRLDLLNGVVANNSTLNVA